MNKSLITNFIAAVLVFAGYFFEQALIWSIGIFALSGAITNWLAIHMLFEKVPFLYGSGVIPQRFEEFKSGISDLVMNQFFTQENIDKFLGSKQNTAPIDLSNVVEKVDLSPSFDALLTTVEKSSFGGMLAMFGGTEALIPLKEPFIEKLQASLVDVSKSSEFMQLVHEELGQDEASNSIREQVLSIVDKRLNELTPDLVKEIVQQMIRKHLGWLVVWGGVFGGVIGLLSQLITKL